MLATAPEGLEVARKAPCVGGSVAAALSDLTPALGERRLREAFGVPGRSKPGSQGLFSLGAEAMESV